MRDCGFCGKGDCPECRLDEPEAHKGIIGCCKMIYLGAVSNDKEQMIEYFEQLNDLIIALSQ